MFEITIPPGKNLTIKFEGKQGKIEIEWENEFRGTLRAVVTIIQHIYSKPQIFFIEEDSLSSGD